MRCRGGGTRAGRMLRGGRRGARRVLPAFVRASMSRVRRSQVAQRASIPSGAVPAVHEASSASRRGAAQVGVSSQASSQVAPRRRAAAVHDRASCAQAWASASRARGIEAPQARAEATRSHASAASLPGLSARMGGPARPPPARPPPAPPTPASALRQRARIRLHEAMPAPHAASPLTAQALPGPPPV